MELYELHANVEQALGMVHATRGILGAEVCGSWYEEQVVQLRHDAEHPSDDRQALQTRTTCGLSILVIMADGERQTVGFGVTTDDLSRDGLLEALEMAKHHVVPEPWRFMLPCPLAVPTPDVLLHDPQVLTLLDEHLTQAGVEALDGALSTLQAAHHVRELQVSGTLRCQKEHLVIGNTSGLLVSDTTTGLLAHMAVHLTQAQSRGCGERVATHWQDFEAYEAGVEAAQQALHTLGSRRIPGGEYQVVFGPQAVAALCEDVLIPALSLDTLAAGSSPFAARQGDIIAGALLTVRDDGRLPGMLGSRMMSGEGLPTGTSTLIEQGRLVHFLADAYHAQHLQSQVGAVAPRNGMRHTTNGQSFGMRPGIFPTNIVCSSPEAVALPSLLAPIEHGVYVGGLWRLTVPTGLRTGHCVGLVMGPSFMIRHGQLAEPIQPGTLQWQGNILELLQGLTGVSTTQQPVALATRQSLVLAPEWRCSQAHFAVVDEL